MSVMPSSKKVKSDAPHALALAVLLKFYRQYGVLRAGRSRAGHNVWLMCPIDVDCVDAAMDRATKILKQEGIA